MIFLAIILVVLASAYAVIINRATAYWDKITDWELPETYKPQTRISVIIAMRNEATNIEKTLLSLSQLRYDTNLLEIIIIDDHSTDDSFAVVQPFLYQYPHFSYIKQTKTSLIGKKNAIKTGITNATGTLIVTTDADCTHDTDWLLYIASYYEATKAVAIAAPIALHHEKNILGLFQTLDTVGMMGLTGAGVQSGRVLMCNGANFVYEKRVFEEVNGFEGNEGFASGDDVFLLHKIAAKYPNGIHFIKQKDLKTTVFTEPKHNWHEFEAQRLRWGTKNTAYTDFRVLLILGTVFIYTFFLFMMPLCAIPFLFYNIESGTIFVILWLLALAAKYVTDFVFLRKLSRYFKRTDLLQFRIFISAFFLYIFYLVYIGTKSLFYKKYEWKARTNIR